MKEAAHWLNEVDWLIAVIIARASFPVGGATACCAGQSSDYRAEHLDGR